MDNSLWIASDKAEQYESLKEDITTDICIIGGGLTGITSAYYLSKEGRNVVVLEKQKIGNHTTRKYNR